MGIDVDVKLTQQDVKNLCLHLAPNLPLQLAVDLSHLLWVPTLLWWSLHTCLLVLWDTIVHCSYLNVLECNFYIERSYAITIYIYICTMLPATSSYLLQCMSVCLLLFLVYGFEKLAIYFVQHFSYFTILHVLTCCCYVGVWYNFLPCLLLFLL